MATLCWLHPTTHAPLCRSSQPKLIHRGDAQLLGDMRSTSPLLRTFVIIDARPWANAVANAVKGHGCVNNHTTEVPLMSGVWVV